MYLGGKVLWNNFIHTEAVFVVFEIQHLNDAVLHKPFWLNFHHFPVLFVMCMFSSWPLYRSANLQCMLWKLGFSLDGFSFGPIAILYNLKKAFIHKDYCICKGWRISRNDELQWSWMGRLSRAFIHLSVYCGVFGLKKMLALGNILFLLKAQ